MLARAQVGPPDVLVDPLHCVLAAAMEAPFSRSWEEPFFAVRSS